ncbi:hypothetical protein V5799_032718 [Amblyomma americanum]|uniref:Uncharacterized protein n=1 Tax=Amblyomma americanum TaxID=6943 RepID=A0AAQ4DQD3_AMBAM
MVASVGDYLRWHAETGIPRGNGRGGSRFHSDGLYKAGFQPVDVNNCKMGVRRLETSYRGHSVTINCALLTGNKACQSPDANVGDEARRDEMLRNKTLGGTDTEMRKAVNIAGKGAA